MKPTVLRQHGLVHISYALPHRTLSTKVYPVRSPNGSSIIIYGHEDGLRILWYGGKPFKQPKASEQIPKVNGTSKKDPMVIDLDDDEPEPPKPTAQVAEFEGEDDEIDPSQPYQNVLRCIDVSFGTSVLHLALPSVPPDVAHMNPESCPPLFSDRILIATGCGDLSIRLVTLPLAPPSPLATDVKAWDVQTVKLFGSATHKDQICSISITHTAETADSEGEADQSKSRSRSRNRLASTSANPGIGKEWSILVASTSCTGTGLLLFHQVPILKDQTLASSPEVLYPIQRHFLRTSLFKSVVSFNSSPYPAERHSNLLLAIPDAGCVKIYQVFSPRTYPRGRRSSAGTIESTTSSSRSAHGLTTQGGKFLLTLYAGFSNVEDSDSFHKRKLVLDASWALGGRAVIVLLQDGEWGVWDIEAAGPSSASTTQNLVKGQANVSGLQGGSLTKFAVRGNIAPVANLGNKATSVGAPTSKSTSLAPLTPHTKKMRSDGLFQGTSQKTPNEHAEGGVPYGSVCITEHPSSIATTAKIMEESVILSFMGINIFIPSLLAYWRSETTGKGTFDAPSSIRPSTLPALQLGGERQHSIAEIEPLSTRSRNGLFGTIETTPHVIAATDHRLLMLASPLSDIVPTEVESGTRSLPTRPISNRATTTDQLLLTQGQLDVDGMDRILSGMENSTSAAGPSALNKSVEFQIDEDDNDVEMRMGTPTPRNQNGRVSRLAPASRNHPRGRIFS